MPAELAPRTLERPKEPGGEIILTEGVPAPVSASPSFENTQAFFSALSFPIEGKNPPKPFGYKKLYGRPYKWERNWEILGRYLGTDGVMEEIGDKYKITRERVSQIVEKLVNQSYESAPATLKESFPRASLDIKKPFSLHTGMRMSQARGGKMREVAEAVLSGKSNAEIKKQTGASRKALDMYRQKGIAVPYLIEAEGKKYRENLRSLANGLLDDRQILKIFEDIEKHNRRRVCQSLREAGVLVAFEEAARNEGIFIHKKNYVAYRLLKQLEIPALHIEYYFTDKSGKRHKLNYFFVLNNHEKTREAFTHPSFDTFRTNPVEVLGRVSGEIPTTSIMNDDAYISVGKFLRERRIPIPPSQVREYLDPDCPVPVFCISSKKGLFIRKEDLNALAGYLSAKLAS